MTEYAKMSIKELVLAHRMAALDWGRTHGEAFKFNRSGNYRRTTKAQQDALTEAMDRCTAIEQEIIRR